MTDKEKLELAEMDILSLINERDALNEMVAEQKSEIERLNLENLQMVASIKNLKSEAIKEYHENVAQTLLGKGFYPVIVKNVLNKVEKEMVGE